MFQFAIRASPLKHALSLATTRQRRLESLLIDGLLNQ